MSDDAKSEPISDEAYLPMLVLAGLTALPTFGLSLLGFWGLFCIPRAKLPREDDGLSELRRYFEIALPLAVCLLGWIGFLIAWKSDHPPQSDPIPLAPLLILLTLVVGGACFGLAYVLRGALAGKA